MQLFPLILWHMVLVLSVNSLRERIILVNVLVLGIRAKGINSLIILPGNQSVSTEEQRLAGESEHLGQVALPEWKASHRE